MPPEHVRKKKRNRKTVPLWRSRFDLQAQGRLICLAQIRRLYSYLFRHLPDDLISRDGCIYASIRPIDEIVIYEDNPDWVFLWLTGNQDHVKFRMTETVGSAIVQWLINHRRGSRDGKAVDSNAN